LSEYAAPTGLKFLLGVGFYKDAAPTELGFSFGKSPREGSEENPRQARPASLVIEWVGLRTERNSVPTLAEERNSADACSRQQVRSRWSSLNSRAGNRKVSRRVMIFQEPEGYRNQRVVNARNTISGSLRSRIS